MRYRAVPSTLGILVCIAAANGCAPDLTVATNDQSSGAGGSGGKVMASSSNASSSSGQGANSASSSSGSTGGENCLNGIDDDGDDAIDCSDSDCTVGYECTADAPTGWKPVAVAQGMGQTPPPDSCIDGSNPDILFTGMAGPADCTPCACGALEGTTCGLPPLVCSAGSSTCGATAVDWTAEFMGATCVKPTNLLGNPISLSCRLGDVSLVGQPGSCMASTSNFPNKDTWSGWIQSCGYAAVGGGCGANQICVAKPKANQSQCIQRTGAQSCPTGWSQTVMAYQSATDDRSCTTCSCNPSPSCTGGSFRFYDYDQCAAAGDQAIVVDSGQCKNLTMLIDFNTWSAAATLPVPGGSCIPSGGTPTGSVTPSGTTTFCCQ